MAKDSELPKTTVTPVSITGADKVKFDPDVGTAAISELQGLRVVKNEFTNQYSLNDTEIPRISNSHDGFLKKIGSSAALNAFDDDNLDVDSLLNSFLVAQQHVKKNEENGAPETEPKTDLIPINSNGDDNGGGYGGDGGGGGGGSGGGSGGSSGNSGQTPPEASIVPTEAVKATTPEVTPATTPTTEPSTDAKNGSPVPAPAPNPSPDEGSAAGIISENPINPNNVFGDQPVGTNTWGTLSSAEQSAVQGKLQELGYTEDQINQIIGGTASAPRLVADELTTTLEQNFSPELRADLLNRYGFDVFNDDGTVNKEKLALALVMDNKSGTDNYSIIDLLHTKYGTDIVNQTLYDNLEEKLLGLIDEYPELRSDLIEKYGFDIFNPDGSINRDKLTLAILMDQQDSSDGFDLWNYLVDTFGEEAATAILGSTTKPVLSTTKAKSGKGIVTTLAGISLLGATGGGLALLAKKKKEAEENELEYIDDDELDDSNQMIEDEEEDTEEEKEWLYGLGLGLAAKKSDIDDYKQEPTKSSNKAANME